MLLSKAVQTRASRSAPQTAAYNVRVHAFESAPQQTLQGLCDTFGLDAAQARRLMASVPAVLRHRVSAADAERCAQALRRLGARVSVENAAAPAPPKLPAQPARHIQPPTTTAGGIGQRSPAKDASRAAQALEYDVLSALDAVLEVPETGLVSAPLHDLGREIELEEARAAHAPEATHQAAELALGQHRPTHTARQTPQETELELAADAASGKRAPALQLDSPAAKPDHGAMPGHLAAHGEQQANHPAHPVQPAPRPHSPVALRVQAKAGDGTPTRALPLLQLLTPVAVVALGLWLDSSVVYGNAGSMSVIVHGLALHQGLLGLRGMFR